MSCPPNPGFQSILLAVARKFGFQAVDKVAGRIEAHTITVESAGADRVRWTIAKGDELPAGFAPRLLSRDAYTALREGDLEQDGSLSWRGSRWSLSDAWNGSAFVATLVPAAQVT